MKTDFWVDIRIKIEAQPIAHARVLLMCKRCKSGRWIRLGFAKDTVEAQTKIAAEPERADSHYLVLKFLHSILKWWRLAFARRSRCHRDTFAVGFHAVFCGH